MKFRALLYINNENNSKHKNLYGFIMIKVKKISIFFYTTINRQTLGHNLHLLLSEDVTDDRTEAFV